ncbi:MAG TPA: PAS domain S-box protein, partial [Cyclobacteriaceae bacterium]|nr:PAS domain S-box protein [Cyclobacteriaceae bacterium]
MITSLSVLLLTCSSFFVYEYITFRQESIRELTTLGHIIASNTTAPLAFDDPESAVEVLSALKAESHIMAACVFDEEGKLFSYYPAEISKNSLPKSPGAEGYSFSNSYLDGFQQIKQGNKNLGTLYLRTDLGAIYQRFQLYGIIALIIILLSLVMSYFLSKILQKKISNPIVQLAQAAKEISDKQDYSVRAAKFDDDELGSLTDSFNEMLNRIQSQTDALLESNTKVQSVINSALSAVIIMNQSGVITDWNERAVKIFGWSAEEVIGVELAGILLPERYRVAHRKGLVDYFNTGKGPVLNKIVELSALRKDGTEFPVELLICTLSTGNVTSFCGFVTDITDRKRAEEEIESFNQKLEQ